MSSFKFKADKKGIGELLKSKEMLSICNTYALRVKARCGEGYETAERHYPSRNGVAIVPKTEKAKKDNLDNNTLLKSLR